MIATLDELDEKALVDILRSPNALSKQYAKLFEYDNVQLEFEDGSLECIAKEAIKRNTGARGLRAILEQTMLDVMYDLPTRADVKKCIITKNSVTKGERPILVMADGSQQSAPSGVPTSTPPVIKAESA